MINAQKILRDKTEGKGPLGTCHTDSALSLCLTFSWMISTSEQVLGIQMKLRVAGADDGEQTCSSVRYLQ
jgi:hypothetical protein